MNDLIEICKKYGSLGWAVQEQLDTILETDEFEGLNHNALKQIENFLKYVRTVGAWLEADDIENGANETLSLLKAYLA